MEDYYREAISRSLFCINRGDGMGVVHRMLHAAIERRPLEPVLPPTRWTPPPPPPPPRAAMPRHRVSSALPYEPSMPYEPARASRPRPTSRPYEEVEYPNIEHDEEDADEITAEEPEDPVDYTVCLAACGANDAHQFSPEEGWTTFDVRSFSRDPSTRWLGWHSGHHPLLLAEMVRTEEFHSEILTTVKRAVSNWDINNPPKFAFVCKHGRHRSVAALVAVQWCLEQNQYNTEVTESVSQHPHDAEDCLECTGIIGQESQGYLWASWQHA